MTAKEQQQTAEISTDLAGKRLDQALAALFPEFSRSRLSAWTKEGRVLLNGETVRPRDAVKLGDQVQLTAVIEDQVECRPQQVDFEVVYEDEHLIVVNKPAGLVVHPAAGNPDGTLQNGLLYMDENLANIPRAGIVHRLDKETTGLMVVARSELAHKQLSEALANRTMKREYRAVVNGKFNVGGTIDLPIGRHPTQRIKMAVKPMGKPAITHYRVLEKFQAHTLLKVNLETGRTHQIRVHMAHLRHSLVGDPVYGARLQLPKNADDYLKEVMRGFNRQALHAKRLSFLHPESGKELNFEVPMPDDMAVLIEALRDHHFGDGEEMEFGDDFYQAFEVDGLEIWEEDD